MKRRFTWLALVLAALVFVITHFVWLGDLPQRLATHFDGAGKPNGWMTRRDHGLLMLFTGLGLPLFILCLIWLMKFLPSSLLNVPRHDYWRAPDNYPRACAIMQNWAQWLATGELIWMTLLNRQIVLANHLQPPRLPAAETWCQTAGFLIMIVASILGLIRRFRQTDLPSAEDSAPPYTAAGS